MPPALFRLLDLSLFGNAGCLPARAATWTAELIELAGQRFVAAEERRYVPGWKLRVSVVWTDTGCPFIM
jgi:hypothetical protein